MTAEANKGLCAPCVGEIERKEYQEYLRLNRKTVDLYSGVTDPVQMAVLMLAERKYDPLIVYAPPPQSLDEVCMSLSGSDILRLISITRQTFESGQTQYAESLARALATITDGDLAELHQVWIAKHHCEPAVMFRSAKPAVRDAIIQALEAGLVDANSALCALAWIGDEVVTKVFITWDKQKPEWTSSLYVAPSQYADVAGWEVVSHSRRELAHDVCYSLTPSLIDDRTQAIEVFRDADLNCPWCGCELSCMLTLDLADPRFEFLSFRAQYLRFLTCHGCTCYETFYAKADVSGAVAPHPAGRRPQGLPKPPYEWSNLGWKDTAARLTRRLPTHAVDRYTEGKCSQVGGLPAWEQSAEYPSCPDCLQTMRFVAQICEGDLPGSEGTYYAFCCAACGTTATTYQQT